jgi:predicted amino acid-binding ACT domain protein
MLHSNNVMHADISEMVLEDELSHLRMLVNATKAKADKAAKKEEKEEAGEDSSSEDNTDGEPDDKSTAGEEEDELES